LEVKMLDKSKPYCELVGYFHGAKFEQGGKYYTVNGVEVEIDPSPAPEPEPDRMLPSVAGGDGFDLAGATKDEIINYAYNRYGRKLDARRSLESLRSQVMYLAE
jgi:hypothetical protein